MLAQFTSLLPVQAGREPVIVSPPCPDNSLRERLGVNVGVNEHTRPITRQLPMTQELGRKLSEGQVSKTVESEVVCRLAIVKSKLAPSDHLEIGCENISSHILFICEIMFRKQLSISLHF